MIECPVLVIDDDPAILSALTRGLRIEGYAEDARSALAAARNERPSAVILDRVIPRGLLFERVWGYELLGASNLIDVTVKNLRRKLNEDGESDLMHTVRRAVYALQSS